MTKALSREEIIKRLFNAGYELIGEFLNTHTKTEIKCLKCDTIKYKALSNVIAGEHNKCMICYGNPILTNDIIDQRMAGKNIKRIGNYIDYSTHLEWQCMVCDYHWKSSPRNILNDNAHCPQCANCVPLSNTIIDDKIKSRPFIRIGNFEKNNMVKIEWECLICNHKWMQKPNAIFNGRGCPKCKCSKGELKIGNILKQHNIKYEIQKTFDDCTRQHNKKRLFFDFYLPDYNLMIEYQGKQHYEPVFHFGGFETFKSNVERDQFKKDYCISHNMKLLEIPYWDFDNIEKIIQTTLNLST